MSDDIPEVTRMSEWRRCLEDYTAARTKLATAVVAYDTKRHGIRAQMYARKLTGEKFTEEHIRSESVSQCKQEAIAYVEALAGCEIAKEVLEFAKAQSKQ